MNYINRLIKNIYNFTLRYIYYFIISTIFYLLLLSYTLMLSIDNHIEFIDHQISKNISITKSITYNDICKISECTNIYSDNFNNSDKKPNYIHIYHNIYIHPSTKSIVFYNKDSDSYIEKKLDKFILNIIIHISILYLISVNIFMILLYKGYKRERNEAMIQNIGNEAILANKSMVMITENVHHELNTPVEVIDNKIHKIHKILKDYIGIQKEWLKIHKIDRRDNKISWSEKIEKLEKDFDYIDISIEQILAVLSKMKNFKSLRYSNGDKTIYDIISGAFRIILISFSEVKYTIDDNFKHYKMKPGNLKNIDLLNVLINHIKNSLEANSTKIDINININTKRDILKLIISDNGQGIPKHIISNIFEPNFSSKQIGDSIRGNGMYLNKHIINEFGGDIKVLHTSNKGTSIELSFPVTKL